MKFTLRFGFAVLLLLAAITSLPTFAQDWVHTGSGLGNARIRLAAADFKLVGADPQTGALKATFDSTLFNDLQNAGILTWCRRACAAGHAGLAAGDQSLAMVGGSGQRGHGGLWRALRDQRPAGGVRLARRHAQHRQSAGAGQAVQRGRQRRTWRARSPTALPTRSSSAWAAASTASPKPRSTSSARAPEPKKCGRWTTTARISTPGHASGHHIVVAAHLARQLADCFCVPGPRRLVHSRCTRSIWAAW